MLNRKSIFALAAVSALAVAALAPTDASAMRGGFGGRGFGGGGHSFGGGRSFGGGGFGRGFARPVSFARVPTGFGHRGFGYSPPIRFAGTSGCDFHRCPPPPTPPNNPPCLINCGGHLPPPIVWWHHHPHWGVVEYQAGLPVGGVATPVATDAVAAGPCNCLTKQYLDDGSVLFKDICTKEAALATPDELKAQAQGVAPQAQAN
jgi:hypothetical protein